MVRISASHAGGPGSIPGGGTFFVCFIALTNSTAATHRLRHTLHHTAATEVTQLPFLVRERVHASALDRAGLPVPSTGIAHTALPRDDVRRMPPLMPSAGHVISQQKAASCAAAAGAAPLP